jgi:hypothetical protein
MAEAAAMPNSSGCAAADTAMSSSNAAVTGNDIPDIQSQDGSTASGENQDADLDDSVPASPITVNTMQQLLKRPFADVLKEITATLQVISAYSCRTNMQVMYRTEQ